MTDHSNPLAQNPQAQNTLAQNENPVSSTLTAPTPEDFETQLTASDRDLLVQLTSGLERRSAAAPNFASEAILRNITSRSVAVKKNRKRKLVGFTVAVATMAGTPFVVRPAITALRGKEKPVVVATSTSAIPKYIVGGLAEKDIQSLYVSDPKTLRNFGAKQLRLRKGTATIDVSTFGGPTINARGPNGEPAEVTPMQIGTVQGKRIIIPSGKSVGERAPVYVWTLPEGELTASATGIDEPNLIAILSSIRRTPFNSGQETVVTIGDKNGFVLVGEASDPAWQYFVGYGPSRNFSFNVGPINTFVEDTYAHTDKIKGLSGREYAVGSIYGHRSYLTWLDSNGAVLNFGSFDAGAKPMTESQFDEMVKLADSVREVDDATFAKLVTSRSFLIGMHASNVPKKVPAAIVLDGIVDGVNWKLTSGETPVETAEKACSKITFSGPAKPFTDCVPENSKEEFVSLGAASVGTASPKTVVFGVAKDTLEIIRVRNSEGTVVGEDFSIENSYLDGRAFAIELPSITTGEVTIEGYSYDDDVADNLPEGQFLPDDAKPLATKTLNVK